MKLLDGKVAVVTGAARGIGKAIALEFAKEGANVAFTDLAIDENGKATEAEIAALGVKAKGYASNAANFEETHKVVEEIVREFGRIDILVNNVGISHFKPLTELSIKEFDRLIATNLRPVFITSRQLALHRQQNGNQQCDCIINLCSTRYLHSEAGTEAYSASKGETSIIHDGLTAEDLRFIPVLFPKSALGTVSSPLYAGRRTSGNGACCSTRF